jgi:hypothetical protein
MTYAGFSGSARRGLTEIQRRDDARSEPRPECTGRENQTARRVAQHPVETLIRQIGIEWHVAGAGLQHGDERHCHVDRPLETDADPVLGPDVATAQVTSKSISLLIQPRIAQLAMCIDDRDGGWCRRRLGFNQLRDGDVFVIPGRLIEEGEEGVAFGGGEGVDGAESERGGGEELGDERPPVRHPPGHLRRRIPRRVVADPPVPAVLLPGER